MKEISKSMKTNALYFSKLYEAVDLQQRTKLHSIHVLRIFFSRLF